jgi:hypothetical protein
LVKFSTKNFFNAEPPDQEADSGAKKAAGTKGTEDGPDHHLRQGAERDLTLLQETASKRSDKKQEA